MKDVDAQQKQRVLLVGKKLVGLEQVQTVVVHDATTWEEHAEELYHQCKLLGVPVIPAVLEHLCNLALREEASKTQAAHVLGVSRKRLRKRHVERKLWRWPPLLGE